MLVHVKVTVEASRESFTALKRAGAFRATVCAQPLRNEANKRVIALVAQHYNIPPSCVRIASGHRRSSKVIEVKLK